MTVSKATGPMWNEVDDVSDPNEQVEMRCKTKRLADCELPDGFRLITRTPRQFWMGHQLIWGFELGFGEYHHIARYLQQVADDVQMQWAIQDFTAELLFAGVPLSQTRKQHVTVALQSSPRTFVDAVGTTGCKATIQRLQ